jgi:hypothetical protein
MYERDTLLKDLRVNLLEVHFTKTNGETRVMRCTLQPHMLPAEYRASLEQQREERTFHNDNPDVLAVWDVDAGGWRSFRIDSIFYCEAKSGY